MKKHTTSTPKTTPSAYTHHSSDYKKEALILAKQIGVKRASVQLGLHESQLYQWHKAAEHAQTVSEREAS